MQKSHSPTELKQDLSNKLSGLWLLQKHPKLFVSDYFYSVRNDIDIEAERLLMLQTSPFKSERINRVRQLMIETLSLHERKCFEAIDDEQKAQDTFKSEYGQLQDRIDQLATENGSEACQAETIYLDVLSDLRKQTDAFKSRLMLGHTFIFTERNDNGFGVLAIFESEYLNEQEVKSLK